jgi:hypothetical protein
MLRTVFLFLLSVGNLIAQQHQVNGYIANHEAKPVSFVNVVLLKQIDSVLVTGTSTDENGYFEFSNVNKGDYILKASFIGFEDLYKHLSVDSNLNLGTLIINEASEFLDEVVLSLQKPTIQRDFDRLIFNVENTSLSSGSTWDILSKTPGVIVQQNNITIRNQPATVYINDRKVSLTADELRSLLESFQGANIKSIEVITNPSAKYDADSGMVLNIVANKNITPGYKGNVSGGLTQAIFPKYRIGTAHFFKNDWVNIAVDYGLNKRKDHKNDLSEITFFDSQNNITNYWDTDFERITRSDLHNINAALDFTLSDRSNLNISSSIFLDPNTTYSNNEVTEILNASRSLDSLFNTTSYLDIEKHNIALDAIFSQTLNDKGASIKANVHFTNFEHNRGQHLTTGYFSPNGNPLSSSAFKTDSYQQINIYFGQIDFSSILFGMNFETGIKGTVIESESAMNFFNEVNNTLVPNPEFSDNFIYDETILSGYLSLAKNWNRWSIRAGLRGEYTETEGNSISMNEKSQNDYLEWFPSFILNYTPNENHSVGVAYNKSISRPRYDLLNPFRYFINENNFTSGNPHLAPSISERYSISYLVESKYDFELYYRIIKNDIEVLSFQNNEQQFLRSVSTNMIERKGYGLNFHYGGSLKSWWYFSNYLAMFHEENTFMALESNNEQVTLETNGMYIQIYNSFTLSKDKTLSADLTFAHLTGFIFGTYIMDPFTTVSLGLRKSLWDNRASLSITANDIFDTRNRRLRADFLNQRNSYFAIEETQYLQVGFVYNFGNFSLRENSRQIRNEERTRINQ